MCVLCPTGDIDINLNSVVGSTKSAKKCTLNQLPEFHPKGIPSEGTFNLFERKRVRGWWPVKGKLTSPPEKKGEVGLTVCTHALDALRD